MSLACREPRHAVRRRPPPALNGKQFGISDFPGLRRDYNTTVHRIAVNHLEGIVMLLQKQITVFLENKPGRLAQLLSELARVKINVIALTVMDRHEHGVLRVVTDDPAATVKALTALNAHLTESEVLAV